MASNKKSQNAINNTIALMEAYEMFNHLTPMEIDTIGYALRQLVGAGYEEATSILTHHKIDLNVSDLHEVAQRAKERRKLIQQTTIYI